jgi:hypothetical protein
VSGTVGSWNDSKSSPLCLHMCSLVCCKIAGVVPGPVRVCLGLAAVAYFGHLADPPVNLLYVHLYLSATFPSLDWLAMTRKTTGHLMSIKQNLLVLRSQ